MVNARSRSLREAQAATNSRKKPKKEKERERDWTALPQGPLHLISQQLQTEIDVVRFRSVFSSWRSAAPRRQSPWVLSGGRQSGLFALSGARIPDIPEIQSHFLNKSITLFGSSHGWLAHFSNPEQPITLFNPITRDLIDLPPVPGLLASHEKKLILSSNPATTSNYTAVILYYPRSIDMRLAIYMSSGEKEKDKEREKAWSVTRIPGLRDPFSNIDVAMYRGLIYIAGRNRLFVCHPAAAAKPEFERSIPIPTPTEKYSIYSYGYLVESCGDLLVVRQSYDCMRYDDGMKSEVFKLQSPRMVKKMESLGDTALFLGQGCSFSLSTTKFPEYNGNHVYFWSGRTSCLAMFNLAGGKEEPAGGKEEPASSELERWFPFLWFRPCLM